MKGQKQTTMRVALADKRILVQVRDRMGCDPDFRQDLATKFSHEMSSSGAPAAKDNGRAPAPAHIDHVDPINRLVEVEKHPTAAKDIGRIPAHDHIDHSGPINSLIAIVRDLTIAIAGIKNGEGLLHDRQLKESKMENEDQPPKKGRKRCEARELAERLVRSSLPGPNGTTVPWRRADIEHHLMRTLGITRNAAQSAASRAVNSLDPGNAARRSHKVPVARALSPSKARHMRSLLAKGATKVEVARMFGCDPKTVQKHSKPKDD